MIELAAVGWLRPSTR